MSRSRYEAVPQYDTETINLTPISSPNYNYNTADIPIPSSPPPSFHSSQTLISECPDDDNTTAEHDRTINNLTPTTSSATFHAGAPVNNATPPTDAALIQTLQTRIERLEESLGRLLLSNPQAQAQAQPYGPTNPRPHNCCVKFPSPAALSPAQQAALLASSNCCVSFRGARRCHGDRHGGGAGFVAVDEVGAEKSCSARREERKAVLAFVAVTFLAVLLLAWVALLVWLRNRVPAGCERCARD